MASAPSDAQAQSADQRYRALLAVSEAIVSHRDDIPQLVRHFTQHFARRMSRRIETIPSAALDALVGYSWPGNIRELQNVIERAVILSAGPALQIPLNGSEERMKDEGGRMNQEPQVHPSSFILHPSKTLADAEREHILGALRETGWLVAGPKGAAARLGMKRSTLYKKMTKLGISRHESRPHGAQAPPA